MNPKTREQFYIWYNENKANEFDFDKELYKYCLNDVDILARACLAYREIFRIISKKDD